MVSTGVIVCVSGMVPGLLSITSFYANNAEECFSQTARLFVMLADGMQVTLNADISADDAEAVENVRWVVVVTPELREAARVFLIEEQQAFLIEAYPDTYGKKARAA